MSAEVFTSPGSGLMFWLNLASLLSLLSVCCILHHMHPHILKCNYDRDKHVIQTCSSYKITLTVQTNSEGKTQA